MLQRRLSSLTLFLLAAGSVLSAAPPVPAITPVDHQTIAPGGRTTFTVTIPAEAGLKGPVTLNVDGLPAGALAGFNPPMIEGSTSSTLGIITPEDVVAADYKLKITATDGASSY